MKNNGECVSQLLFPVWSKRNNNNNSNGRKNRRSSSGRKTKTRLRPPHLNILYCHCIFFHSAVLLFALGTFLLFLCGCPYLLGRIDSIARKENTYSKECNIWRKKGIEQSWEDWIGSEWRSRSLITLFWFWSSSFLPRSFVVLRQEGVKTVKQNWGISDSTPLHIIILFLYICYLIFWNSLLININIISE